VLHQHPRTRVLGSKIPATIPRPMALTSSGSSSTANRPAAIGSYGVPPSKLTLFLNSCRLAASPMIGSDNARTANRGSAKPVLFLWSLQSVVSSL